MKARSPSSCATSDFARSAACWCAACARGGTKASVALQVPESVQNLSKGIRRYGEEDDFRIFHGFSGRVSGDLRSPRCQGKDLLGSKIAYPEKDTVPGSCPCLGQGAAYVAV